MSAVRQQHVCVSSLNSVWPAHAGGLHSVDLCGDVTPIHLVLEKHSLAMKGGGLNKLTKLQPCSTSTLHKPELVGSPSHFPAALPPWHFSSWLDFLQTEMPWMNTLRVVFQFLNLWRSLGSLDHSITGLTFNADLLRYTCQANCLTNLILSAVWRC